VGGTPAARLLANRGYDQVDRASWSNGNEVSTCLLIVSPRTLPDSTVGVNPDIFELVNSVLISSLALCVTGGEDRRHYDMSRVPKRITPNIPVGNTFLERLMLKCEQLFSGSR
jgi:hypothetical protein